MLQMSPQRFRSGSKSMISLGSGSPVFSYSSRRIAVALRLKTTNWTPPSWTIAP